MSTYDWLLFLHLLGAAAVVAALVFFAAGVVGALRSDRPSRAVVYLGLARSGGLLFDIGGTLLLVFGIWLAFEADYGLLDEWVLAALVLFAVASFTGTRTRVRSLAVRDQARELIRAGDAPSGEVRDLVRTRGAIPLYAATALAVLAMLLLMIFKPGAG